ncbi:MAG: hypothetical protein A2X36_05920 [Elusimicrobia bacterium GWA2_69_24]|nr:MAG: hypothetical protein A2X36_05920 [Elusimicrobia bacterium GWA2_69_24]HBL17296.1 hypothetical protein [Elusimicrobiota bacterium]
MGIFDKGSAGAEAGQQGQRPAPDVVEKIVKEYGAFLESYAPKAGRISDVAELPHPKERIKEALLAAFAYADAPMKELLRAGYVCLYHWQEQVGDPDALPEEARQQLHAYADEEQKTLQGDLERLGLL